MTRTPPSGSRQTPAPSREPGTSGWWLIAALIVLGGCFIFIFQTANDYFAERARYQDVVQRLAAAQEQSNQLEFQHQQWQDDDYVRSQARERLSYVVPGETTYVVIGAHEVEEEATREQQAEESLHQPWYRSLLLSSIVAGHTPLGGVDDPAATSGE